jgi:hypothetical protein
MTAPPPEAILKIIEHKGGTLKYGLKKTVLILQEKGEDVELRVSAEDSYDIDRRPLTFRWKLLCGNKQTSVERDGSAWRIRVPWDDALPEGRTTLLLIANNGQSDGNPAAINIWRHKTASMPGTGAGYNDYQYDPAQANRRPFMVGLQDVAAKPGETVRVPIRAIDPEGFVVSFAKRAEDPGRFEGSEFVYEIPKTEPAGRKVVTVIASDGTSGNSYDAQQFKILVAPKIFAHIKADRAAGAPPLKVKLSSEGSFDVAGKLTFEWAFAARAPGYPQMPKPESNGPAVEKTFDKPGVYQVWLKAKGASGEETTMMTILVSSSLPAGRPGLALEGNGVELPVGREAASEFDGSNFGTAREREFRLVNTGSETVKPEIKLSNPEFHLVDECRSLTGFSAARLRIRFAPKGPGLRTGTLEVSGRKYTLSAVGNAEVGEPEKPEAKLPAPAPDKEAARLWSMAMNYKNNGMTDQAERYFKQIVEKYPESDYAKRAREMIRQ